MIPKALQIHIIRVRDKVHNDEFTTTVLIIRATFMFSFLKLRFIILNWNMKTLIANVHDHVGLITLEDNICNAFEVVVYVL